MSAVVYECLRMLLCVCSRCSQPLARERADVSDAEGWTALLRAAEAGRAALVRILLECGCDIAQRGNMGVTPLHLAARHARTRVIEELIRKGASPSVKDDSGRTPFDYTEEAVRVRALCAGCELMSNDVLRACRT